MKLSLALWTVELVVLLVPVSAHPEEVKITGLHLCCATCVQAVEDALDVDGVYDVQVDRESKCVVIKTDNPDEALKSLARAGFHGRIEGRATAQLADKPAEAAAKSLKLVKAHLCCANCQKLLVAAIRSVPNVETVEIEDEVATVTSRARGVMPSAVLEALHKAGFHAQVEEVKE